MRKLMIIALLVFLGLNFSYAKDGAVRGFQCDIHPNSQEPCLVSWSPNGKWIATTTKAIIKIDIWDIETKNLLTTLPTHADTLSWNEQGNRLATITEYEINIWNIEGKEKVNAIDFRHIFQDEIDQGIREVWPSRFTSIDWDDITSQIAIVTLNWIGVWQLSTGNLKVLNLPSGYNPSYSTPLSLAWSPLGDHLAVAFSDGNVALYDSMTLDLENLLGNDRYYMNGYSGWQSISWSPDGQYFTTDGINTLKEDDIGVRIFDLATGEITFLQGHSRPINAVAWSPSGEYIASGSGYDVSGISSDNTIQIWDAGSYQLIRQLPFAEPITSISWNPESTQLAVVDLMGIIYIMEIE